MEKRHVETGAAHRRYYCTEVRLDTADLTYRPRGNGNPHYRAVGDGESGVSTSHC